MNIELTEQQQQALDVGSEQRLRVIDPRNNSVNYLVAVSQYEAVRQLLDEEQRQRSIRAVGLRNAAGRIEETP